jgi:hypothetical protein
MSPLFSNLPKMTAVLSALIAALLFRTVPSGIPDPQHEGSLT